MEVKNFDTFLQSFGAAPAPAPGPQPVQIVQPMYKSAKQNIDTYRQYTQTRPRLESTKVNILIFFFHPKNYLNNND